MDRPAEEIRRQGRPSLSSAREAAHEFHLRGAPRRGTQGRRAVSPRPCPTCRPSAPRRRSKPPDAPVMPRFRTRKVPIPIVSLERHRNERANAAALSQSAIGTAEAACSSFQATAKYADASVSDRLRNVPQETPPVFHTRRRSFGVTGERITRAAGPEGSEFQVRVRVKSGHAIASANPLPHGAYR